MNFEENMKKAIVEALRILDVAQEVMTANVRPFVSLPRGKEFVICPGIKWPGWNEKERSFSFHYFDAPYTWGGLRYDTAEVEHLAGQILQLCQYQPRLVLRALRRIQATIAWCEARTEGRKRAAEEILRQQAKAVEALEAEAALQALK